MQPKTIGATRDARTAEDARALLSTPSHHTVRFSRGVPVVN